jgi:hypothetical protein
MPSKTWYVVNRLTQVTPTVTSNVPTKLKKRIIYIYSSSLMGATTLGGFWRAIHM